PAVGGRRTNALWLAEQHELLGHLKRELACRREHERGRGRLAWRDELDDRQPGGERLPRAGWRLAEDVAALERVGDDERLDTKRLDDAAGGGRLGEPPAPPPRPHPVGHQG